jgi:60 kDa SS-A/Ro ribonucleoprotein
MSMQHLINAVSPAQVPQSEPLPGQTENSAGGFAFGVDDWTRLDRFLVLGTEGGSYYASERELTLDNVDVVRRCLTMDGPRTVNRIAEISEKGRAPKNDQAILALAVALKHKPASPAPEDVQRAIEIRQLARWAVKKVCRTGTHVFHLAAAVNAIGGWGPNVRKAFADWYLTQAPDDLAYQVAKYQQRDGWSHLDVLRKAHPKHVASASPAREAVFRWVHRRVAKDQTNPLAAREVMRRLGGINKISTVELPGGLMARQTRINNYPAVSATNLPHILHAFDMAQAATTPEEIVRLIMDFNLPRECVPTQFLTSPAVWDALLRAGRGMPIHAMIRNLGKMSEVGLLTPNSDAVVFVVNRLANRGELVRARVHPVAILMAQSIYSGGHGFRGGLTWQVSLPVVNALEAAFYAAFDAVEPTGKRYMLALDISPSMGGGPIAGTFMTPRQGAAAMSLVTARTEPWHHCVVFAGSGGYGSIGIDDFDLSGNLAQVVQKCEAIANRYTRTDCSLPIRYATERKIPVDAFVIYTDSETWSGPIHPVEALRQYRRQTGIPAKMIVVGMVANSFSIADPNDAGMLDVVGFDTNTPAVMADFVRGG